MTEKEHMAHVVGFLVVSEKEGAKLGAVSNIFIDIKSNKVSGLCFKTNKLSKEEHYVKVKDIQKIGRDVIFISHEDVSSAYTKSENTSQKSLAELIGHIVTTAEGQQLGKLTDLDIDDEQWTISELWLDHNKRVPVDPTELKIGPDQLILPHASVENVVQEESTRHAFLKRIIGPEGLGGVVDKVKHKFEKNNKDDSK